MEQYTDITVFVKSFELSAQSGTQKADDKNIFIHSFPATTVATTMQIDAGAAKDWTSLPAALCEMKMDGKYWFDKKFVATVRLLDVTINKDGGASATYEGIDFKDTTNYGIVARLIRWMLRR